MNQPLFKDSEKQEEVIEPMDQENLSQSRLLIYENEKRSLQELNDRLYGIVEVLRQRSDTSASFESPGTNFPILTRHIEAVKLQYDNVMLEKNNRIEKLISENSGLKLETDELRKLAKNLQEKSRQSQESEELLTNRLQKVDRELLTKDSIIMKHVNDFTSMKQKFTVLSAEVSTLKRENLSKVAEISEVRDKNQKLIANIEALNEKIHLLEMIHKNELSAAYQTIEELNEASQQGDLDGSQDIDQLRLELQEELSQAKMSVVSAYKTALEELETRLENAQKELKATALINESLKNQLVSVRDELDNEREKCAKLKTSLADSKNENELTIKTLRDRSDVAELKLAQMTDKLYKLMSEYEQLVDNHVLFDTELSVYQSLLDSEEKRLGITHEDRVTRANYEFCCEFSEKIDIDRIDTKNAIFLVFLNKTNKNLSFTSFKMRITNGEVTMEYRIPKITVPSMELITVGCRSYVGKENELFVTIVELESFAPNDTACDILILNKKDEVILKGKLSRIITTIPTAFSTPYLKSSRKRKMNASSMNPTPIAKRYKIRQSQRKQYDGGDNESETRDHQASCNIC